MHSHEFCYWIQGYFELREDDTALTRKQMDCIVRHVELVNRVEKTHAGNFVNWIKGAIQTVSVIDSDDNKFEDFSAKITELIANELSKCFEHEIDNKYGVSGLGEVHKPPRPPFSPSNDLIRC